ncbi:hypothetical protein R0K17_09515 [Planococcus sp. SIMBA_143]
MEELEVIKKELERKAKVEKFLEDINSPKKLREYFKSQYIPKLSPALRKTDQSYFKQTESHLNDKYVFLDRAIVVEQTEDDSTVNFKYQKEKDNYFKTYFSVNYKDKEPRIESNVLQESDLVKFLKVAIM